MNERPGSPHALTDSLITNRRRALDSALRLAYRQRWTKEMLKVAPLSSVARRLARTRFGQRALTQPDRPGILKQKPTKRVYGGLVLMALSALTGLPALAVLSYLSVRMGKPLIIAVGGPVVFALVHIIFGLGVYLAGQNYAIEALLWLTRRFLEKHA